jgi:sulfoxide reductase heme-binding subunit YedZ
VIAWDVTRASAFVAFGAYTLSIAWGIVMASRSFRPPVKPQFDFHRFLASLACVALCVHVATVLVSHANHVRWPALVYVHAAPAAVAGVTATWLALFLPLSFRLKAHKLLATRSWRRAHYLGYAVWGLALLHGLGAGTDTRARAALTLYGSCAGIVVAALVWRAAEPLLASVVAAADAAERAE